MTSHERTAMIRLAKAAPAGSRARLDLLKVLRTAALQGRFYLFTPVPLESLGDQSRFQMDWEDPASAALPVLNRDQYVRFKRNLSTNSFSGSLSNFIYEIQSTVSLFDGSERDCYRLLKAGLVDLSKPSQYFGVVVPTDPVAAAKFLSSKCSRNLDGDLKSILGVTTEGFRSMFDGLSIEGLSRVFLSVIRKHAVLIDGTSVRTDSGPKTENEVDLPDWVMSELIRYTNDPSKKMRSGVIEWLTDTLPKSYASRRVYRGFGTQIDDFGDYSALTLAAVNKRLYSRTGIRDIGQVRVGGPILVKRGKESSWSANPQAASNFASGMAAKSLNFLVKAEVPASRVVIDFTELPVQVRQRFKFHGQAEVIVSAGPIEGVLGKLWLDKDFVSWLDKAGYDFIPQKGIFKR